MILFDVHTHVGHEFHVLHEISCSLMFHEFHVGTELKLDTRMLMRFGISPASEWIFPKIFAVENIMVSNGSLGSKE